MASSKFIGRVGALAVALGVGVVFGPGFTGLAWADEAPSTSDNTSSESDPSSAAGELSPQPSGDDSNGDGAGAPNEQANDGPVSVVGNGRGGEVAISSPQAGATGVAEGGEGQEEEEDETPAADDKSSGRGPAEPPAAPPALGSGNGSEPEPSAPPVPKVVATATQDDEASELTEPGIESAFAARTVVDTTITSRVTSSIAVDGVSEAALVAALAAPAPDPVAAAASAVVEFVLAPIRALVGLLAPSTPAEPPLVWALLAWVRREFERTFLNKVPTVTPIGTTSQGLDAEGRLVITGTVEVDDAEGDPVRVTVGGAAHGTVTIDESTGVWTYRPDSGYLGPDQITVTVEDTGWHLHGLSSLLNFADAHTATRTVSFTVENRPPVPDATPFTVDPRGPDDPVVTGKVNVTDPDGHTLTYTGSKSGDFGVLSVDAATGRFSYTPSDAARHAAAADDAATTGADRFAFEVTAEDGHGGQTTVAVSVEISPVANDAPDGTWNLRAPAADGTVTGTPNFTDEDTGDTLTYGGTQETARGFVEVDPVTGALVYTPKPAARHAAAADNAAADGADKDTFTLTVDDGHGGVTSVSVTVTVAPLNADPTANPTFDDPAADGTVSGNLNIADDDEGDTFALTVTLPARGSVLVNPDGSFTYTPSAEARLRAAASNATDTDKVDSFTVEIDDGHGGVISVTVSGLEIAPADVLVTHTYSNLGRVRDVSVDGNWIYSVRNNSSVVIIDNRPGSDTYRQEVKVIGTDNNTGGVVAIPDGRVLTWSSTTNTIQVFDVDPSSTTYGTELKRVPFAVASTGLGDPSPVDAAVTPDGTRAYVLGISTFEMLVIELAAGPGQYQTTTQPAGSPNGAGVQITPDGKTLTWATNGGQFRVQDIDPSLPNDPTTTVMLSGNAVRFALSPDSQFAYAVQNLPGTNGDVYKIDLAPGSATRGQVVDTIPGPGEAGDAIAVFANGTRMLVVTGSATLVLRVYDIDPTSSTYKSLLTTEQKPGGVGTPVVTTTTDPNVVIVTSSSVAYEVTAAPAAI